MEIQVAKQALRRAMVATILAMDPARRERQETALANQLALLPGYDAAGTVLLYVSAFPEEFSTRPMLRQALEQGRRVVCPRVDRKERRLRLYLVEDLDRDLVPGMLGIPEPGPSRPELESDQVDWVLVPGLAFDARGYRLGRGAGHYDRLLPRLRPEVPRWALAFDEQLVERLPVEPHDQPLDGVWSPGRRNEIL